MQRLCSVNEVAEGSVFKVELEGRPAIAVYRVNGELYATADLCTHAEASLSEGLVDGDIIECPLHGGAFFIATGEPSDPPCTIPLQTYKVKVEGEDVFAELP